MLAITLVCYLPISCCTGKPGNLYHSPVKDSYNIGDMIRCIADANPTPVYLWQNMETLATTSGSMLNVIEAMVGTQLMKCQSQNTIDGSMYSTNFYVNITVNREFLTRLHKFACFVIK